MPSVYEMSSSLLAFYVCSPFTREVSYGLITSDETVFHAALVIFAAIQIHETKAALVRTSDCDGTNFDYVVCSVL